MGITARVAQHQLWQRAQAPVFCPLSFVHFHPQVPLHKVRQANVWQAQSPCGFAGVKHVDEEKTKVAVEPLNIIAAPITTNATDQWRRNIGTRNRVHDAGVRYRDAVGETVQAVPSRTGFFPEVGIV